jgi:hypothetical protein
MGGLPKGAAFAALAGAVAVGCATAGGAPLSGGGGEDATASHGSPDAAFAEEAAATRDGSAAAEDDATLEGGADDSSDDGSAGDGGDISDSGSVFESDAPSLDVQHEASTPADASGAADAADAADDGAALDASTDASTDAASGDGAADAGAPADAAGEAGSCGCDSGFACGSSHYCATTTGVPQFGRVFVIVLDNQPLSAIQGSASAPYLNGLMAAYAYGTAYSTPLHPSLPNFIDLTSGNPQQIACECTPGTSNTCTGISCNGLFSACACPVAVSHIGDELDVAGIPWREYAESMGAPCNPGGPDASANFAPNHVPFLYYSDVFGNSGRCMERVRDYGDFAADLEAGSIRFALISPDLCDDMHGGCSGDAVKEGDQWLAAEVPAILATPGFAAGGSDVLFIVGDEPDLVDSVPVPFVVVSPLAKHVATAGAYTHDSLLTTIEDGLALPRLGNTAGSATIADVWR